MILNIVSGVTHNGNVVVISPRKGPISDRFIQIGAAVRIGEVYNVLADVSDCFLVLCNTIMTADIIVKLKKEPFPTVWILHEWWTDKDVRKQPLFSRLALSCQSS